MKREILILAVLSVALESRALFPSRAGIWGDDAQTDWYTTNSAAAVFELGTERDLAGLARLVNQGNSFSGKTLRLTRGVSLGTHFWTPIGNRSPHPFEGSFEGGGNLINGVVVTNTVSGGVAVYSGLFGIVSSNASIRDLGVTFDEAASTVDSGSRTLYAGSLAGRLGGAVSNCACAMGFVLASTGAPLYAGGIAGWLEASGSIVDSTARSDLSAAVRYDVQAAADSTNAVACAGGLAGYSAGVIAGCGFANGSVAVTNEWGEAGPVYAGGAVGYNAGALTNVSAEARVSGQSFESSPRVGAFAGFTAGEIVNCVALGSVEACAAHLLKDGADTNRPDFVTGYASGFCAEAGAGARLANDVCSATSIVSLASAAWGVDSETVTNSVSAGILAAAGGVGPEAVASNYWVWQGDTLTSAVAGASNPLFETNNPSYFDASDVIGALNGWAAGASPEGGLRGWAGTGEGLAAFGPGQVCGLSYDAGSGAVVYPEGYALATNYYLSGIATPLLSAASDEGTFAGWTYAGAAAPVTVLPAGTLGALRLVAVYASMTAPARTGGVPVPFEWLDRWYAGAVAAAGGDRNAAACTASPNGLLLWQDYLAGITNGTDVFRALIAFDGAGVPVVTPSPSNSLPNVVYELLGTNALGGASADWPAADPAAARFFRLRARWRE